MTDTEMLGYLASLLVLATFCTGGMVSLRILAIASNLAFIGYAWLAGIHPVLLLHLLLLPINAWRLIEAAKQRSGAAQPRLPDFESLARPSGLDGVSAHWPNAAAQRKGDS